MAHLKDVHGGNVYTVAREIGCDPAELVDFSASINPLGPSPAVWKAIVAARRLISHYPDPSCWELRRVLGQQWGIDPDQIVVGNGSIELINALPHALHLRRLLVLHPTFSEYERAMARTGGTVRLMFARRQEDYAIPVDRLCERLRSKASRDLALDGLVLCNPNSPTGQACSPAAIAELAKVAAQRRLWLVVDEAFADYCPQWSVLPNAVSWPRVIVLRSMTKFYALPGLRVGYAVAARSVARQVQRQLPHWSVNLMGQVAALAALGDRSHVEKSRRFMVRERERFVSALKAIPGCQVFPSLANYVFVELPRGWHARVVTERLRHEGLLIRDCSSVPGSSARSIRLAVRTSQENDRLIESLSKLLLESHG
ncbi:MAG: threonine-phosphate decarboxylase CobD [Nitrospira sp.]|nr:threonine-phosphate decarboxylase CobD [Nitrospira sp.]MCP9442608.1 threonine-phosphate decarboxylase CobD [Nitrospira sp.]